MYISLSQKKITYFASFIALLGVALLLTFTFKGRVPSEYFSVSGVAAISGLPIKSLGYRLGFSRSSSESPLAAVGAALGFTDPGPALVSGTVANDVPVLVYHGITNTVDRFNVTPSQFNEHMTALKRAGYHTITLEEMRAFVKEEKQLDDKAFLLTFDDGRSDSYFGADPVLSALDFNAVMFVAASSSVHAEDSIRSYYLHDPILKRMIRSGRWEVASHAVQETGGYVPVNAAGEQANFLSNKKWLADENRLETDREYDERIERELSDSKDDIEKALGNKVYAMSYPFGDYGQQNINNPRAEGVINEQVRKNYEMAFRQVAPNGPYFVSNYPEVDSYFLHRLEPLADWKGADVLGAVEASHTKTLPFTDNFSNNKGWNNNWGSISEENGELTVQASADTSGAFTFLDGTYPWRDYFFAINGSWDKGEAVSLAARYQDRGNLALCTFTDNRVRIDQRINGKTDTLAESDIGFDVPKDAASFGIRVEGTFIRCYAGSRVVAYSYGLSKRLSFGGVGLQVWDGKNNNASLTVTSASVVAPEAAGAIIEKLPSFQRAPR